MSWHPTPLDKLSRQDAGYLHRETADQPMHFVVVLEATPAPGQAPLTLEGLRGHLAGRLARVPELRRAVRFAPRGVGPAVWVEDRSFALERHVLPWGVEADTHEALLDAVVALTRRRLPRDRPLWDVQVARPRPDGCTPVALSLHHAMSDGGFLRDLMLELFGSGEAVGPAPAVRLRRAPSRLRQLSAGLLARARDRLAGRSDKPAPVAEAPAGAGLTGAVGPSRSVTLTSTPLEQLQRLREATGATVNDLLLCAVTDAAAAWLGESGRQPEHLLALVPRDVRVDATSRALGNQTWPMLVDLPVAERDPQTRLRAVRARTAAAKSADRSAGNAGFAFDLAVSNVRLGGPHLAAGVRLRLLGASAPLQGENCMLVLGISQDDRLTLSTTADPDALDRPDLLARELRRALDRLQVLAP